MKIANLYLLIKLLIISSCSHYNRPESFQAKMARYTSIDRPIFKETVIPLPKRIKSTSRLPASKDTNEMLRPKDTYFLVLYSQMQILGKYLSKKSYKLDHCPALHNAWLKVKNENFSISTNVKKYRPKSIKINTISKNLEALVEWNLPITKGMQAPTVLENFKVDNNLKKNIENALDTRYLALKSEVDELCEYSTSPYYYTYENFVSQAREGRVTSDIEGLRSLLKMIPFNTHALLSSLGTLNNKGIFWGSSTYKRIIQNLWTQSKTQWSSGYFEEIYSKRSKFN